MKRIALLTAALMTTMTGSAAFAAAEVAAPTTPPEALAGGWLLEIDGAPAGQLTSVAGCAVASQIQNVDGRSGTQDAPGKRVIGTAPEPCRIEFGTDMSPDLYGWINDALGSRPREHQVRLVRNDIASAYALNLTDTMLSEFTIPKIDASDAATFRPMALTLQARKIRRAAAAAPMAGKRQSRGLRTFDVTRGGKQLRYVTSIGPWTAKFPLEVESVLSRDPQAIPGQTEITDLPLDVAEPEAAQIFDPWVDTFLSGRATEADETTVSVKLGSDAVNMPIELSFERVGPARADLAPRASLRRHYELYADRAAIAVR